MAKFIKWRDWRQMAQDLSRGLYRLTFSENLPAEFVLKDWDLTTFPVSGSAMTVSSQQSWYAQYYSIKKIAFFFFGASVQIGGTPDAYFDVSLPKAAAKSNLATAYSQIIPGFVTDGTAGSNLGILQCIVNETRGRVFKADGTAFAAGAVSYAFHGMIITG